MRANRMIFPISIRDLIASSVVSFAKGMGGGAGTGAGEGPAEGHDGGMGGGQNESAPSARNIRTLQLKLKDYSLNPFPYQPPIGGIER